eukprot:1257361-Rhodomonas_salina.1
MLLCPGALAGGRCWKSSGVSVSLLSGMLRKGRPVKCRKRVRSRRPGSSEAGVNSRVVAAWQEGHHHTVERLSLVTSG